jgi:hypothetical protein
VKRTNFSRAIGTASRMMSRVDSTSPIRAPSAVNELGRQLARAAECQEIERCGIHAGGGHCLFHRDAIDQHDERHRRTAVAHATMRRNPRREPPAAPTQERG